MTPSPSADAHWTPIELHDGMHALTNRALAGRAVVFIHGAGHDHRVWLESAERYARNGAAVLLIDLPGHGRSRGPALADIEPMAEALIRAFDAARLDQVQLVGHSMGSLIALEIASRATRRVKRLTLVGTAFPMRVAPKLLDAARDDRERAIAMINRWSHRSVEAAPERAAFDHRRHDLDARWMREQPDGTLLADLRACDRYANGIDAAERVACPTLGVLAHDDRMTPAQDGRAFLGRIRDVRVVELADCGHALMNEAVEPFVEWLERHHAP